MELERWAIIGDYGIDQGAVSNLVRLKRRRPELVSRRATYRPTAREIALAGDRE